jgi:DNA-binding transcriptional LysR family regulator
MQDLIRSGNEPLALDLSTRQLYAFAAVAASLSYARAAERFHYTEPGLYLLVRRLEKALGCRLFERDGRGLRLTRPGQVLLPYCRSMLADLERMNQARWHLARVQHLSVVAGPVTGSYLLPEIVRAFAEAEPGIEVDLSIRPIQQTIDLVARGAADLAVAGGIGSLSLPEHVLLIHWFDRRISLLAGGALPLALTPPVAVYAFSRDSRVTSTLCRRLEEFGIMDYEVRAVPSADAAKGACLAGLGYALLPRQAAELELRTGVLRELPDFSFSSQVWIGLPPEDRQSPASRAFVRFLHECDLGPDVRAYELTPQGSSWNGMESDLLEGGTPAAQAARRHPGAGSRRPYAGGRRRRMPERTRNLRAALMAVCRDAPYLTRAEFARECSAHTRPCGHDCPVEYVAHAWGNWNGRNETLQHCLPSRATIYNNWPGESGPQSH